MLETARWWARSDTWGNSKRSPGSQTAQEPVENGVRTGRTIVKSGAATETESVRTVYQADGAAVSLQENKVDGD